MGVYHVSARARAREYGPFASRLHIGDTHAVVCQTQHTTACEVARRPSSQRHASAKEVLHPPLARGGACGLVSYSPHVRSGGVRLERGCRRGRRVREATVPSCRIDFLRTTQELPHGFSVERVAACDRDFFLPVGGGRTQPLAQRRGSPMTRTTPTVQRPTPWGERGEADLPSLRVTCHTTNCAGAGRRRPAGQLTLSLRQARPAEVRDGGHRPTRGCSTFP